MSSVETQLQLLLKIKNKITISHWYLTGRPSTFGLIWTLSSSTFSTHPFKFLRSPLTTITWSPFIKWPFFLFANKVDVPAISPSPFSSGCQNFSSSAKVVCFECWLISWIQFYIRNRPWTSCHLCSHSNLQSLGLVYAPHEYAFLWRSNTKQCTNKVMP